MAKFCCNSIFRFADNITVVGWILNNDKMEYRKEMKNLVNWCDDNKLSLNVNIMKEIVIDFRKRSGGHAPVYVNGDKVEMVQSFRFLGIQITNNLSWSPHADTIVKKAQQRL